MSRLIFVPQFPSELRYQEFFYKEFPKELSKYFEVIVLGKSYVENLKEINSNDKGLFAPRDLAIEMEFSQIREYLNMKLYDDDILLVMDLSYPGFFINSLYHNNYHLPENSFCYCHATSKNNFDVFPIKKFECETAHSKLFKKVFVGSNYHKKKLGWNNVEVVGLPIPPFNTYREKKECEIISVVRPNYQKVTKVFEDNIEKNFCEITRKNCKTWEEYYKFLSSGKVLLITTKEETFGYSTMESIMNGTVVIAPNRFSYPELLPRDFLYDDFDELSLNIWAALKGDLVAPKKILCHELCENFYENISNIMKGEN